MSTVYWSTVVISEHNMQTEKNDREMSQNKNGKHNDDNKRREQTATICNNPFLRNAKINDIVHVGKDIVGCVLWLNAERQQKNIPKYIER